MLVKRLFVEMIVQLNQLESELKIGEERLLALDLDFVVSMCRYELADYKEKKTTRPILDDDALEYLSKHVLAKRILLNIIPESDKAPKFTSREPILSDEEIRILLDVVEYEEQEEMEEHEENENISISDADLDDFLDECDDVPNSQSKKGVCAGMISSLNTEIDQKKIKQELPTQNLAVLHSVCNYELDDYEDLKQRLIRYYVKARINGLLALENNIQKEMNATVREIYMLCIDGYNESYISEYIKLKAFWLITLAKQDFWRDDEYIKGLKKELNLIGKLALSTRMGESVAFEEDFDDYLLPEYKVAMIEEDALPELQKEIDSYFHKIMDIDDSFVMDIKYLVDLMERLFRVYRTGGVEFFLNNTLQFLHKKLADTFTQVVVSNGLEACSAKEMLTNNKNDFYKNKEYFSFCLAVRYILEGYSPRTVEEIVMLVYPEVKFREMTSY